MKSSPFFILAAGLCILSGKVSAQEPRPPAGPSLGEVRPPSPRDDYRTIKPPPPAAPRHLGHRPMNRPQHQPGEFRSERERRPEFRREPVPSQGGPRPQREEYARGPAPRDFASRDDRRTDVRSGPRHPEKPAGPHFGPRQSRRDRPDFGRRENRPAPEFGEGRPHFRPPPPPEQNYRNLGPRSELREFAPVARGPRPAVERPRERDDRWEHRAPRFPREDAGGSVRRPPANRASEDGRYHSEEHRRMERAANRPQPLPFQ